MGNRQSTLDFMTAGIRTACRRFRGRCAGSVAERRCQQHFKRLLTPWCDAVILESFTLHPKAFLGWMVLAGALNLCALALYWAGLFRPVPLFPALGLAFSLSALLMGVCEFLLYRRLIDPLFPQATSCNLYARRRAIHDVHRRIIFGGHADAAYEMRYFLPRQRRLLWPVTLGSVLGMLGLIVLQAALLALRLSNGAQALPTLRLGLAASIGAPFFIGILFFVNWRVVVDGANDNLSGCFTAMAVLKELSDQSVRYAHTEVCCLITGAEEAGLRGAQAFAQAHRDELAGVETVFIALDTLKDPAQLMVYPRGINGLQPNSPEAVKLLQRAAAAHGRSLPKARPYPGATDAEAFSRAGLAACSLCGVDQHPQRDYHTRYDTSGNVNPACLRQTLSICLEAVRIFDREGLGQRETALPQRESR